MRERGSAEMIEVLERSDYGDRSNNENKDTFLCLIRR